MKSHPDDLMTRAYLAELLYQEKRTSEAAAEFEAFIAAAQPSAGKPHDHLVHCHMRLMNIAEEAGDEYREHLHRGIGLWQLVQRWDHEPNRRDERAAETTLIQAMNELKDAQRKRPNDPRVQLYLAEVALRLGQQATARNAIRQARALPPLGLTPSERQRLAALAN